jgi:hypothetical protein
MSELQALSLHPIAAPLLLVDESASSSFIKLLESPIMTEVTPVTAEEIAPKSLNRYNASHDQLQINTNIDEIAGSADEPDWEEIVLQEDEYQKIIRLLKHGDSIVEIINCGRLVGLELIEGILLICQENIYLIDNYFRRESGEIVDIDDVPFEVQ